MDKSKLSNPRAYLHLFFWCPVCGTHGTNYYDLEDWQQHQADLEEAKAGDLICENCLQCVDPRPELQQPEEGSK